MVVSAFTAMISYYWQVVSSNDFISWSFDWLISFLDSFRLSGLLFTTLWYFWWKHYPDCVELLYTSWFSVGVALNVLIAAGSLHLDWSWANFVYQVLRCLLESSISFVQIFGILSVLKTLTHLNTNIFVAVVIVYFIHHFGFGENIRELKSITNSFVSRCLNVEDNTHQVIDLMADAIGLNSFINNNADTTYYFEL